MGRLLLNYVLSDPYVDVALVGMREPRFAELDNEISDDVASRIDGHEACLSGAARPLCALSRRQASPLSEKDEGQIAFCSGLWYYAIVSG